MPAAMNCMQWTTDSLGVDGFTDDCSGEARLVDLHES
jgi:hypothetical protein